MKKGRTIFLVVYLVFHLILLVAAIVVNLRAEDFEFLFTVRDNMGATVWFATLGLILFIVNVVMISVATRNHKKQEENLRQDINSLKAKFYDLQDAKPATGTTEDKISGSTSETKRISTDKSEKPKSGSSTNEQ